MEPDRGAWRAATGTLRKRLDAAFSSLIAACDTAPARLDSRPGPGRWTSREVLEHVVLTDHFLLRLIDKLATTSLRRTERGDPWPTAPPDFAGIEAIALSEYRWEHPTHMTPTGERDAVPLSRDLASDRERVATWLTALPEGQGTLHRIRMSVVPRENDRLHLYEYILVLVLHAERHVAQIERNHATIPD